MKLLNTTIGKKRKMNGNESVTYCRQIKPFFYLNIWKLELNKKYPSIF